MNKSEIFDNLKTFISKVDSGTDDLLEQSELGDWTQRITGKVLNAFSNLADNLQRRTSVTSTRKILCLGLIRGQK